MNKTCALQPFHGSPPLPGVGLTATVSRQANVYSFAAYRQGMKEEMGQINQANQAVEIAISAVIQGRGGHTSFWALAHRGPQADFHRRDGFVVEL